MENTKLKQLPLGISTFSEIIEHDYVYVDKTRDIYNMAAGGKYYFLSRPRRFGKSLLVSTLDELFSGNKDLFKNLWVGTSDWQWQKHPVMRFDFSAIAHRSTDELITNINVRLDTIAHKFAIDVSRYPSIDSKFEAIIAEAAQKNKVVILVDEYDKPILDHITNSKEAKSQREVLKSLYSVIKASDQYLRFVLLTGVSKFAKTSIFSGINNLQDVSMDARYAMLLGYTDQELINNFLPHINRWATQQHKTASELIDAMKERYDGYQFMVETQCVYNPFSVLLSLDAQRLDDFWFETGTPTFLASLLRSGDYDLESIDRPERSKSELGTLEIDDIPLATLLFQTGYLTIKSYDDSTQNYTLDFPNNEVTSAFSFLMTKTFAKLTNKQTREYAKTIAQALREHDLEKFRLELQDLVDTSPYVLQPKQELHLQMTLYTIGRLIGLQTQSEVMTSTGRADLIMTLPDIIYIIELKINQTAQIALQQILDKRYHAGYVGGKQQVELVGVNFDTETKTVTLVHQPV